jgi:hypothetical protein
MKKVNIYEAKTRLSQLVDEAEYAALARYGDVVKVVSGR